MQLPPNCRTETKDGYFVFVWQLIMFSSSRKNFSTLLNKLEYCLLLTIYIQTSIYLESCNVIIHTNLLTYCPSCPFLVPKKYSKLNVNLGELKTLGFCIFSAFLAVYDVFPCVCTAGCRCSREDQPCVPGWEKRPGCDVLWPEALLWQHLPGVAVCGFWFSVAPSMGPLWVGLPRPGERYCTTEEDQARGDDISTAKAAGQGSWWTSVTYTDPVTPGSLFLKVYFFFFLVFLRPAAEKI